MEIKPNKLLGQNFLKCSWVSTEIVSAGELNSGDLVLEIGPGTGALTRKLAKHAGKILAVEKDFGLAEELKETLKKEKISNVEIITGDILKLLPELSTTHNLRPNSYKIAANIPYYLTSHLLKVFLEEGPQPSLMVLTIQKEVAERITAKDKMSLLALSVQVFGQPEIIKKVPASCFWPEPKVDSAIIKISNISEMFFIQNKIKPKDFFELIRLGFAQKRKMLINNLSKKLGKAEIEQLFKNLKISPQARAEDLTKEDWADISHQLN